jgi:sugar O-acyltransferase (sialic acid O-acetyltransferase NeuD family)
MKNLIIIGARGFGREVYNLAQQTLEHGSEWTVKGFLDNKHDALEAFEGYPPVLSSVEEYVVQEGDVFICALGNPADKKHYVDVILAKGGIFTNIVHPTATINRIGTAIGTGVIIGPYTYISNNVTIENFVTIQTHVAVGHDVKVGSFCQINSFAFFGGFSKVGTGSTVNPGAIIVPKKTVGEHSVVGANSSVLGNVKNNTSVYGNPAKILL